MNTEIVTISAGPEMHTFPGVSEQWFMRKNRLTDWLAIPDLAERLSGTVKKNAKINMKVMDQLRSEALAQTLGWTWESMPSSYVTFNDAISEGDSHAVTEAGWFAHRYIKNKLFKEDIFECKYIIVDDKSTGQRREGIGLICRQTNIQWIQPGSLVFCIITEWDPIKKEWLPAQNPF